ALAHRYDHPLDIGDGDIAVRGELRARDGLEPGVERRQQPGDRLPRVALPATQAADAPHGAVELDDAGRPGPEVEVVDVLRDDAVHDAGALELREREVPRIRLGAAEPPPTEVRARPVPLARELLPAESFEGHRRADWRAL